MKKLSVIASVIFAGFSVNAVAESTYIPSHVEEGLIKICKTAAQDKLSRMNDTIKEFNLRHKTVALNVVCNGKDIISFAEHYGANKTTARLSSSVGTVEVTDIAAISQLNYDVKFTF